MGRPALSVKLALQALLAKLVLQVRPALLGLTAQLVKRASRARRVFKALLG